ncbi:hypothetical protein J32TS2_13310 [Shouchella clausii]|uniref:DUF7147 family protein n=1 Tax=Shouchella clausii TaxID=79880 RepID=UPI001B1F6A3B|nr:methylthioribose kinase [Shouchella clausii]GIN15975.1 hypothetical protein J32TS2_13310 [Shouchella clausii]
MIQRFIELGNGYTDFFELLELAKSNAKRAHAFLELQTEEGRSSLAVCFKPAGDSQFMPIYICREGFQANNRQNKRLAAFYALASELGFTVFKLEVKPKSAFYDIELYDQYLVGLLRFQRILPPLS